MTCSPTDDRPETLESLTRTFRTKVTVCSCGCWLFASTDRYGYSQFKHNGRNHIAHRWMWERLNGPLDDDEVLDHRCDRHRNCVNPDHLEPTSVTVNAQRANARRLAQGGYGSTPTHDRPTTEIPTDGNSEENT